MIIYRELLVSKNPERQISVPYFLVYRKQLGLLLPHNSWDPADVPQSGTNSTLLGCCRKIYDEALPILYGENVFFFNEISSLRRFKERGLAISHRKPLKFMEGGIIRTADLVGDAFKIQNPIFGFQPNGQGRCAMVQHLALRFKGGDEGLLAADASFCGRLEEDPDSWAKFIHQTKYTHDSDGLCFTSLKTLKLDFSDWGFSEPNTDRTIWVRFCFPMSTLSVRITAAMTVPG